MGMRTTTTRLWHGYMDLRLGSDRMNSSASRSTVQLPANETILSDLRRVAFVGIMPCLGALLNGLFIMLSRGPESSICFG